MNSQKFKHMLFGMNEAQFNLAPKCTYDNKTPAKDNCNICNASLCSSCGYVYPASEIKNGKVVKPENQRLFCNECWVKFEKGELEEIEREKELADYEAMRDYQRNDGDVLVLQSTED